MIYNLKNGKAVEVRLLEKKDKENLFEYFDRRFSKESKSRFGPHPFDIETINSICQDPNDEVTRYVATDDQGHIIAYVLIKKGMIEWDEKRYATRQQSYDYNDTVTFAPSVADEWQRTGLGSLMNTIVETDLAKKCIKNIILWGGVQASNEKAVKFYNKLGYQFIASFSHDGKDNHDMVKQLF